MSLEASKEVKVSRNCRISRDKSLWREMTLGCRSSSLAGDPGRTFVSWDLLESCLIWTIRW